MAYQRKTGSKAQKEATQIRDQDVNQHNEKEYTEAEYIDFINYLLKIMNIRQLRHVLYNVNKLYCGGYFESPPEWMRMVTKQHELTVAEVNNFMDQMRTFPMDIRKAAAEYLLKDGDQA